MKCWSAGIDEVGRGPLAGPVGVGMYLVNDQFDHTALAGIRDSKALSARERDRWYALLRELPHARHAVALIPASCIDSRGIQAAIRQGLAECLSLLDPPTTTTLLLDGGLRAPERYLDQQTIIRGDVTQPLISAAAIMAKVTRDRYMSRLHDEYPEYGFAAHKGYGTRAHRIAIGLHGFTPEHRTSFCARITKSTS